MTLEELQEEIQPADQDVVRLSKERWMKVGKPLFSLGKLETADYPDCRDKTDCML